ncbi:BadF/BadG/BcrA/BcrD ATPase family protein [Ruegeria atlantica]|uniref:BadF/BadG/BcrA/BcrD ATPase family protein n=1 Tax=Ruegeria atlantica TaxID=81569 RepID=UPI00249554AD|nr:BadF/BadG/BcrA/BcrD ATPase family protein [Ruegeria atlantica]
MKYAGIDIGSTTVKGVVFEEGNVIWKAYGRHQTRQAEKALELLARMEQEAGLAPGRDIATFTGSGAGTLAGHVNARTIQEVVAVAAAVESLHPDVHFVSEIGGEDMKTLFFTPTPAGKAKQVYMQSACSGGTGTFIEKSARKLDIAPDELTSLPYEGQTLHRISAKCGIFAETDANSLVKAGVSKQEIIASLFDAVVRQNLATLTKGNTPMPSVLLLGGPNMFFRGLQEAWAHHLAAFWQERKVDLPEGKDISDVILVPDDALYYASLGCVEIARRETGEAAQYAGTDRLKWWVETGQHEEKAKVGQKALARSDELDKFMDDFGTPDIVASKKPSTGPLYLGCDFGSTTVKAVAIDRNADIMASIYRPSRGNPIEDAKTVFRKVKEAGVTEICGLGLTGYGKDLLKDILGADVPVVETVAHASAALHVAPDADAICDVGGTDVKIMLLRQQAVVDFRLNSQCSSGNGAFLQGIAERYDIRLEDYADKAFSADRMPQLMMGCGVFLQSDIVNQQRKGWAAEEIMASLAAVLPLNVWVYAGQFQNLKAIGKKFILQGGTHRNLAVVKAQIDFIKEKIPDAEIIVHPHAGEAGALGAALLAADCALDGNASRFVGFDRIEALEYVSTTNDKTTCHWCAMNCSRAFIDVQVPSGPGKEKSKVPLANGWERIITGNSCSKGLIEDAAEMKERKKQIDEELNAHPNIAESVRDSAFR